MNLRVILRGMLSYFPFFKKIQEMKRGAREPDGFTSAKYCYTVWLRHLIELTEHGSGIFPKVIAELGPGSSLGVGLAALISGGEKYFAFDIIEHASNEKNLEVFDHLVELFKSRSALPADNDFPKTYPKLADYSFPVKIFPDEKLRDLLNGERLQRIRQSLTGGKCGEFEIRYFAPWDQIFNEDGTADLILSQAVMEHVKDPLSAYRMMNRWLSPGGFISHQIDFSAHETHKLWNGHWTYPTWLWKIIMHGRMFYLNRYPHSIHIREIEAAEFEIIKEKKRIDLLGKKSLKIHSSIKISNKEDLEIRNAFIQAVKKTCVESAE